MRTELNQFIEKFGIQSTVTMFGESLQHFPRWKFKVGYQMALDTPTTTVSEGELSHLAVDEKRDRFRAWRRISWCLFAVAVGIFASPLLRPKQFRATCNIQVGIPANYGSASERFLGTQIYKLTTPEVLADVVRTRELAKRWSMDAEMAIQNLQGMCEVEMVHGTDILTLAVWSDLETESLELVNAIVTAFVKRQRDWMREIRDQKFEDLKKLADASEAKVEGKQVALMDAVPPQTFEVSVSSRPLGRPLPILFPKIAFGILGVLLISWLGIWRNEG